MNTIVCLAAISVLAYAGYRLGYHRGYERGFADGDQFKPFTDAIHKVMRRRGTE